MSASGSRSVTIAVVGTGLIGPRHAQSVLSSAETTLQCIVDPNPAATAVASQLGVPLYESVPQMLNSGLVPDAAIVCTPNRTHVAVSKELLAAGVHVLVEKPIATTIDSGQELVDYARLSGKTLLVGHHRRFNPYVTATKRALSENTIGKPIAVSGLWATYKPSSYFEPPAEWRTQAGDGGPILINLIHDIDILQYLLGPINKVYAERTISQRGFEAEEGAAVLLRFASGVVGTFVLSDATPSAHTFEHATGENPMIPRAGKDTYRILGSDGTLSVGDMQVTKHASGTAKSWSTALETSDVSVGNEVPFDEQVNHLVRVVRREESPVCSGEDGLSALRVCDAIKQALEVDSAIFVSAE